MQLRWAVFAAGMLAAVQPAAAQTLPPVEAFGDLPFISQPQLSPDGKHFAGIQSLDGKPAAVVYTVNSPDPPQVFASDNWLVHSVHWVKNDRVVMFTKTSQAIPFGSNPDLHTWYRAISLQVGGTDWVQLFDRRNESVSMNSSTADIVDKMPDDPNSILMPLWTRPANDRVDNDPNSSVGGGYGGDYRFSLYRVDVHTGNAAIVEDGGKRGGTWLSDGTGGVVGRVDWTPSPQTGHLFIKNGGSWSQVRDFEYGEGNTVQGLLYDGAALAFAQRNEQGRMALYRMDRTTGATGTPLFSDPHYDFADTLADDWTDRVIGVSYGVDKAEYVYFDPARAALQHRIAEAFPGEDAHAVSATQSGDKVIVAVESPQRPRTYYFMERDTHYIAKIASAYPNLKATDLGEMKPYPYKARDGLDIAAYLTLPPGRPAKNLPLVVMPHGGPDGRDTIGFDWWAQFLANRGYAVLQPNFRGSFGYGLAFSVAGRLQWGRQIQDDISDGVKKAIADGIADGKRVCIVGASFGGYAALAGATFSPDLYACAASIAGPSDLGRMMNDERRIYGTNSSSVKFWEQRMGTDSASFDAASPALHAGQVRAPVLLMHGKLDTTVAYAESEEEQDALTRAGKKVELVTFDADDHYLTLAETRIKMLTTLEAFLKANIGN
ncbi:MAG TPA: S9 family peptidase [Rhizomicrobium sp.]|jgi:dipeptidyl aminopeptidase/acylaminoacyl peptidase|nr:S9 family peptidase [Rhizomicrobium sp.]